MRRVKSVSFDEGYVVFRDTPTEKVQLSEIELLRRSYMSSTNRQGIYHGDIVRYYDDNDVQIAQAVYTEEEGWHFRMAASGYQAWPFASPHEYEVVGNIYENPNYLTENGLKDFRITHIRNILSTENICDCPEICRHDLRNALADLSLLTKEELIELIHFLADDVRYYKKAFFIRDRC